MTAIKDGNLEEAKSILRNTLKVDPENEQVALLLGAISAGTGELEEGAQLLTENLDPETTPVQFIRAATMAQNKPPPNISSKTAIRVENVRSCIDASSGQATQHGVIGGFKGNFFHQPTDPQLFEWGDEAGE